jgi:hypothetical protein
MLAIFHQIQHPHLMHRPIEKPMPYHASGVRKRSLLKEKNDASLEGRDSGMNTTTCPNVHAMVFALWVICLSGRMPACTTYELSAHLTMKGRRFYPIKKRWMYEKRLAALLNCLSKRISLNVMSSKMS